MKKHDNISVTMSEEQHSAASAFDSRGIDEYAGQVAGEIQKLVKSMQKTVKRIADTAGAVALLCITSPLFMIIGLAVKLTSSGEVFYKQTRIGFRGRPFTIYKFRTMRTSGRNEQDHQKYIRYLLKEGIAAEKQAESISSYIEFIEDHITPVGKVLRATSLDELPQLYNILKGDMSFVGPRPHPEYEVAEYKQWYRNRLSVKPGLTGWSKLKIRMTPENYEQSILFDLWYVRNWNIFLDLRIVLATVPVVFFMKDAH